MKMLCLDIIFKLLDYLQSNSGVNGYIAKMMFELHSVSIVGLRCFLHINDDCDCMEATTEDRDSVTESMTDPA